MKFDVAFDKTGNEIIAVVVAFAQLVAYVVAVAAGGVDKGIGLQFFRIKLVAAALINQNRQFAAAGKACLSDYYAVLSYCAVMSDLHMAVDLGAPGYPCLSKSCSVNA